MSEENYDEEYVINILAEHANLHLKYGQMFADQSDQSKAITERKKNVFENKVEHRTDQSHLNRTFEQRKTREQN